MNIIKFGQIQTFGSASLQKRAKIFFNLPRKKAGAISIPCLFALRTFLCVLGSCNIFIYIKMQPMNTVKSLMQLAISPSNRSSSLGLRDREKIEHNSKIRSLCGECASNLHPNNDRHHISIRAADTCDICSKKVSPGALHWQYDQKEQKTLIARGIVEFRDICSVT